MHSDSRRYVELIHAQITHDEYIFVVNIYVISEINKLKNRFSLLNLLETCHICFFIKKNLVHFVTYVFHIFENILDDVD